MFTKILCFFGIHKTHDVRAHEINYSGMYKGSFCITRFVGCKRCPRKWTVKVWHYTQEAKDKHCWDNSWDIWCNGPGSCACRCDFCEHYL